MVSPTSKSRLTIAIENDPNDECGGGGLASPFEAPAPFSFINKSIKYKLCFLFWLNNNSSFKVIHLHMMSIQTQQYPILMIFSLAHP